MTDQTKEPEVKQEQPVEETKDRVSEQFEKLTTSNKELKEERDTAKEEAEKAKKEAEEAKAEAEKYKKLYKEPTNEVPDKKEYPNLEQKQIDDTFRSMVDENGYLDGNKLVKTLSDMDARARQAEERAKRVEQLAAEKEREERDRKEKEAQGKVYEKYPMLNPDNKEAFDPKMWRYVFNELAMKAKAGKNPTENDYIEAADQVYKDFHGEEDMSKKDDEVKAQKESEKKTVNSIHPASSIQAGYYEKDEESDLIRKVQAGKRGSVAEMLRRRGQ